MRNLFILISLCLLLAASATKAGFKENLPPQDHSAFSRVCLELHINEENIAQSLRPTPNHIKQWLKLANILRHGNEDAFALALSLCANITTGNGFKDYDRALAYLCMSKIKLNENELEFSYQFAERAFSLAPSSSLIKIWLAVHPTVQQDKQRQKNLLLSALCTKDPITKAQAFVNLGNIGLTTSDIQPKDSYLEALKLLRDAGNHRIRAEALIGLGDLDYTDEETPLFTDFYRRALRELDQHDDAFLRARALVGLGDACQGDNLYPDYLDYYFEAIPLLKNISRAQDLLAKVYIQIGNSGYTLPEHKDPRHFYICALNTLDKDDNLDFFAEAFLGLAHIEASEGNYQIALSYLQLILKDPPSSCFLQEAIYAYQKIDDIINGKY